MTGNPATGLLSDGLPPLTPLGPTVPLEAPSPQSRAEGAPLSLLSPLAEPARRILDFDIETLAAGFADPQWVPQTVTAWACAWTDDEVITVSCLPVKHLFDKKARRKFVAPLLELIAEADMVAGHNIIRFDLPVLNAEAMRLNLPLLRPMWVQDTMRFFRTKGFKKGQDNLGDLLEVPVRKRALNWQEWQDAYAMPGMDIVKERVVGDVQQHLLIRKAVLERGWIRPATLWRP